jgi:NAD(P)-dependent dehydrogenase (short-subunit alcohol dehydrogenase family)
MDLRLSGLSAVVTGGSAGIGAAIVKRLAAEGCNVAFCSRDKANVQAMLNSMPRTDVQVSGAALDVADKGAFADWLGEIGAIDIFIPNVSAISPDWEQSIEIDLLATVHGIDAVLPYLRASNYPAITYIGSLATASTIPSVPGYGAMKKAMEYHVRSLSRPLAGEGIRANIVSPGATFVEGGWWDHAKRNAPDLFQSAVATIPIGRMAAAEEIARVVAFISSPAASFVAGANWFVDGAQSIPSFSAT